MGDSTVEKLLCRVGMSVFVQYYEQFNNARLSSGEVVALLPGEYTLKSRWSRTSKARRIIREGLAGEALGMIVRAERVEPAIVEGAKRLLGQMRSNVSEEANAQPRVAQTSTHGSIPSPTASSGGQEQARE